MFSQSKLVPARLIWALAAVLSPTARVHADSYADAPAPYDYHYDYSTCPSSMSISTTGGACVWFGPDCASDECVNKCVASEGPAEILTHAYNKQESDVHLCDSVASLISTLLVDVFSGEPAPPVAAAPEAKRKLLQEDPGERKRCAQAAQKVVEKDVHVPLRKVKEVVGGSQTSRRLQDASTAPAEAPGSIFFNPDMPCPTSESIDIVAPAVFVVYELVLFLLNPTYDSFYAIIYDDYDGVSVLPVKPEPGSFGYYHLTALVDVFKSVESVKAFVSGSCNTTQATMYNYYSDNAPLTCSSTTQTVDEFYTKMWNAEDVCFTTDIHEHAYCYWGDEFYLFDSACTASIATALDVDLDAAKAASSRFMNIHAACWAVPSQEKCEMAMWDNDAGTLGGGYGEYGELAGYGTYAAPMHDEM